MLFFFFFLGDTTKALEAVAEICAERMDSSSLGDLHIVEHPAGHITLKKLIALDKEKMKNKESGKIVYTVGDLSIDLL